VEPPLSTILDQIDDLHIVLSHYHLDHIVGLTWLPKVWPKPFTLHAPEYPLSTSTADEALDRISCPPLFALPLSEYPGGVAVRPLSQKVFTIGDVEIQTLPQSHSGGSAGYRVGNAFAYITDVDTTNSDSHVTFVANVDLVLADAMYDETAYMQLTDNMTKSADHGYALGVADMAANAGVQRLALVHISPEYPESRVKAMVAAAKEHFSDVFLPEDGVELSVDPSI
jgi:ribonuclease BN (tRNA processing enzyme)